MSSFNEKAGTFILTAVQVANDVKRVVEERVKAVIKDSMAGYDAELASLRERVETLEKVVLHRETPATGRPSAPKKAKAAKKTAAAKPALSPCAMPDCGKASISKGLCKNHYYQFRRGSIVRTDDGYAPAKKAGPSPGPAPEPTGETGAE